MRSDWILDVLADLRAFAISADMPNLAKQLDDTAIVAMAEIACHEQKGLTRRDEDDGATGLHSGELGAGRHP